MTTRCGYGLADVRASLRSAIDQRGIRAAQRWTAELVATDGAVGSLWAAYWVAWAAAQGAGDPNPVIPILLNQTWNTITEVAKSHLSAAAEPAEGWSEFRNNPAVRHAAAEMTQRLLLQARQTPVVWPSKELILFDVSSMRDSPVPAEADSPTVTRVWQRGTEAMELRLMAGRFLAALQGANAGLRTALSAVAWTLLPAAVQGPQPFRVAERGPAELPPKARASPIWFWLDIGGALLSARNDLHRGWITQHAAVSIAFETHWKRWTAGDRMRVLLAWILSLRAALHAAPVTWEALPVTITQAELDLPYKEIAAELSAGPLQGCLAPPTSAAAALKADEKSAKKEKQARIESRLADTDTVVLSALGIL